ncbi:MAG: putative lipid II flippase FtsW [Acidimicrobiales bacterium]
MSAPTLHEPKTPIGRLLRSARSPQPRTTDFKILLALILAMNFFGLLMILSASSVTALYQYGSSWYQFRLQFIWFLLGCTALFVMSRFPYERLSKLMKPVLLIAAGLMAAVLLPGVGVTVNGSSRWLGWGPLRMQPSELVKLAVILYAADTLTRRVGQIGDWKAVLRPIAVVFVAFAGLLIAQPNLGTTIILATIVLVMLFVGGVPGKPLAILSGGLVLAATFLAFIEPYRFRRLMAFRDPWADPLNAGFQTIQSQVGFANGGVLGTGLGQGRAKWGFLPEAHTDFIYAIIGEEMGLIGSVLVISMFLAFALFGIRTALHARDRFGAMLATGITTWILIQGFINIGASVGVLPITGVPLPFISAGGSSLLFTMAASGILLNIARQER